MNKTKYILEKIIKIIIIVGSIVGIMSTILLFRFHVYNYSILISFYPQELVLFLCLIGILLMTMRFKMKYLKWIILAGIILSGINLVGFKLLLKTM
mgnify:CR=1 FL=1